MSASLTHVSSIRISIACTEDWIYECNYTDDRVGKSFAHYLWGESICHLLAVHIGTGFSDGIAFHLNFFVAAYNIKKNDNSHK